VHARLDEVVDEARQHLALDPAGVVTGDTR
jgi:hypothetical protein